MAQPEGYMDATFLHYVCNLNKALYGLKQAPRTWFNKFKSTFLQWKFQNSKANTSLFFLITADITVLVLIYVDDILVTDNSTSWIDSFIRRLHTSFALKDMGHLHYYLGVEAFRTTYSLYLTQSKYILHLLERMDLLHIKPSPTFVATRTHLSLFNGAPLDNPTTYRSLIGGLQYLTHTRPDIAFIVNKLSQFLQRPTPCHWKTAKHVLCYLRSKPKEFQKI